MEVLLNSGILRIDPIQLQPTLGLRLLFSLLLRRQGFKGHHGCSPLLVPAALTLHGGFQIRGR